MKKFCYFFPIILFIIFFEIKNINAQIPNGDFEKWTNGIPDSCIAFNITQSTDKYSGNFAAKGIVDSLFSQLLAPEILIDFPISKTYANLTGYYKLTTMDPNDVLSILVTVHKDSSTIGTGGGFLLIGAQTTSYNQFTVPINYSGDAPKLNRMDIEITIEDTSNNYLNTPARGSFFIIDDLQLSETATGINDQAFSLPNDFKLEQNYPNPFNPTTTIRYSIPKESFVTIKVYDVIGKEITSLVNERKSTGNYSINFNASNLPSGIYFYRMQAGNFVSTKKLVLLR